MEAELRQKILIIDDVTDNIEILAEALKEQYEVLFATSGETGLEIAGEELPDLILLDIIMPDMDGYETCQRLKSDPKTEKIPVIFVTAMHEVEDETKGLALGAVDYITKPIKQTIVRARIKTHLSLKQAYEDLQKKNKKLEETVALRETVERINRHDIKTPLNGIINAPTLLMEDSNLTPAQKELLVLIRDGGYRILEMVNNSLNLYKIETGTYPYEPTIVDVLPLLQRIVRETGSRKRKQTPIEIRLNGAALKPSDRVHVWGEDLLCYSLFANLLTNASEASPQQDRIDISLSQDDNEVAITIHNPQPVPEHIRGRFFEKYVTAGKQRGTGLGTYSAKLMAETMQGNISMQTSEDAGTAVTVRLRRVLEDK